MKAIVQERFGPPDVLQLADADLPEVGADQVLVRVHAAALNPYDWHMMRGDPFIARLMGAVGLTRPKSPGGRDRRGRTGGGGRRRRARAPARRRGDGLLPGLLRRVRAHHRRPAGAQAREPDLRAGRGRTDGGGDRPARHPDGGQGAGRAAGAGQRGRRRRGHVRRPDRRGPGRGGHRGVQRTQRRAGALTGRRARRRLRPGGLHRRARALRRDPGQRGQPPAEPAAPGAHPDRDPGGQRWRLTRPRVRGDGLHAAD